MNKTLYFLIGPTAVGKTDAAVAWALSNNAEILCADAPLVYRGMDIATAKPTPAQQKLVPHHGLDWVDISESFSVGNYLARAKEVVASVSMRGKNLLIVGGSGFYLKSFFEPVVDGLEVPDEVVAKVADIYEEDGLEGTLRCLRELHPQDPLTGLDTQNPRRVIKALERCLGSGLSYSELKRRFEALPQPYAEFKKQVLFLNRERDDLRRRATLRVQAMFQTGLLREVQALRERGLENYPQPASTIGYRETLRYLAENGSLSALKSQIVENTLGLVRKQLTFFKQLPVDEALFLSQNETLDPRMLF